MLVKEDYYYNFNFQKSVKKKPNTKWEGRQNQEQRLIFKSIDERFPFS